MKLTISLDFILNLVDNFKKIYVLEEENDGMNQNRTLKG